MKRRIHMEINMVMEHVPKPFVERRGSLVLSCIAAIILIAVACGNRTLVGLLLLPSGICIQRIRSLRSMSFSLKFERVMDSE